MAPHALVIPYPVQGHINPLMQLSQRLASKGLLVTFVNTQYSHSKMVQALGGGDHIIHDLGLDLSIRCAQISDGLPLDFDRVAYSEEAFKAQNNMGGALEELICKSHPPVSCIIADAFLLWTLDVAKKVALPWVAFWPQPLTLFVMYTRLSEIISNPLFPPRKGETIDYIPGLPPLQAEDLPPQLQTGDLSSPLHRLTWRQFELIHEADWILGNTMDELESEARDACNPRVCSVGPLVNLGKDGKTLSMRRESDCLPWLNTKPKSSVIYVSFGSMIRMSAMQMEEIAKGLLESEQFFVWVLRPGLVEGVDPGTDILPEGFLEKAKDRGLVVPWAPQVLVLSHPSVGGFFTHCGWNSTLESLSLGVPMLTFPNWFDQYTNRMLIAKQWKIGMTLKVFRDDGIVEGEEIAKAARALMECEEGKVLRSRASVLKETANGAVRDGGPSSKNLDSFVRYLALDAKRNKKCERHPQFDTENLWRSIL